MSDSRNPFYTASADDRNPFSLGGGGGGGRNPFATGQDRQAGSFDSYNPGGGGYSDGRPTVQQQLQASQDRQLDTQRRALQSIYSSESMGVDTAQELVRQGEVLNRTEEKLDHIEAVQKESQRHITSLSSVFGGFKNWFRGDSAKKKGGAAGQQYEAPGASLDAAMAQSSSTDARRIAAQEPAGFGTPSSSSRPAEAAGYQQQQQQQRQAQPASAYDRAFSENLGEMEHGMSRIKQLALGLGSEIDRQNVQLERMSTKTDKTNSKMDEQNAQMNRILYGNKAPPKS